MWVTCRSLTLVGSSMQVIHSGRFQHEGHSLWGVLTCGSLSRIGSNMWVTQTLTLGGCNMRVSTPVFNMWVTHSLRFQHMSHSLWEIQTCTCQSLALVSLNILVKHSERVQTYWSLTLVSSNMRVTQSGMF